MANTIKLKRSNTSGAVPVPGDLVHGELAINRSADDQAIFYKDASNNIQEIVRHCGPAGDVKFMGAGTSSRVNLEVEASGGDPRQWTEVYRFTITRTASTNLYMHCNWAIQNGGGSGMFLACRVVRDPDGTPVTCTGIVASALESSAYSSLAAGAQVAGSVPLNDNDALNPADESMTAMSPHCDDDNVSGSQTYAVELYSSANFTGANTQYVEGNVLVVEQ